MDKLKFIGKCCLLILLAFLINFIFHDDVHSYTRVMIHEMYESEENIDAVFIGASHVYRGIDPAMADELIGMNTFNASSSSQQLKGSYYLLREICETNDVKTVFLDVTYGVNTGEEDGERETYLLTDYMKNGENKFSYLWSSNGLEGVINDVFPAIHTSELPTECLQYKFTEAYKNYGYDYISYDNEAYVGKGFVYSYEQNAPDFNYKAIDSINEDNPISEYSKTLLADIIDFCKGKGIELILLDCPMPDATLAKEANYELYDAAIRRIADEHDVIYWNFNMVNKNVMTVDHTDYKDSFHLNGKGAEIFTQALCDVYNGKFEEPFYQSFSEKLMNNPDGTYKP